jgi:hypothetical protein
VLPADYFVMLRRRWAIQAHKKLKIIYSPSSRHFPFRLRLESTFSVLV